jgi:hypothetical protein
MRERYTRELGLLRGGYVTARNKEVVASILSLNAPHEMYLQVTGPKKSSNSKVNI